MLSRLLKNTYPKKLRRTVDQYIIKITDTHVWDCYNGFGGILLWRCCNGCVESGRNQKRTRERMSKRGTSDKEDHRENAKVPYGHVKRRDERHVLSTMLDAPAAGKIRGGIRKTRWRESFERDMQRVHGAYWTGQRRHEIFITIPGTSADGKSPWGRNEIYCYHVGGRLLFLPGDCQGRLPVAWVK